MPQDARKVVLSVHRGPDGGLQGCEVGMEWAEAEVKNDRERSRASPSDRRSSSGLQQSACLLQLSPRARHLGPTSTTTPSVKWRLTVIVWLSGKSEERRYEQVQQCLEQ